MSDCRVSVSYNGSHAVCKIHADWSVNDLVVSLRTKLKIDPEATTRVLIEGGAFDGAEVVDLNDLCDEDKLRVEVTGGSGGIGGGAGGGGVAPEVAMEWLSKFVTNPEVAQDIKTWRDTIPEVSSSEPPEAEDKIAEYITKVAPIADKASQVIDVLTSIGIGLGKFGEMLNAAPFSAGLTAIGKLFEIADLVCFNIENCNRVRRRVAALLPVLVVVWRQTRADKGCTVSEEIHASVIALANTIDKLTEAVKEYCDAGFLKRAFKSSSFRDAVAQAQDDIDKDISVLQTALSADQGRKLDTLLSKTKDLHVSLNVKLDSVMEGVSDLNVSVDGLKEMLEARTKEIMTTLNTERTDLVLVGVTDVKVVEQMLLRGTDRKVFVRDRGDKGEAPIESGGPSGHHYSCDFKGTDGGLHSFRFTQRTEDGMFVLDEDHEHQRDVDGKIRITAGPGLRYKPGCLAYKSMMELLLTVSEVCVACGFDGSSTYHALAK